MKSFNQQQKRQVVPELAIKLDRAATWNEIRCAVRLASGGGIELASGSGIAQKSVLDAGECEPILPGDLAWYALAIEAEEQAGN